LVFEGGNNDFKITDEEMLDVDKATQAIIRLREKYEAIMNETEIMNKKKGEENIRQKQEEIANLIFKNFNNTDRPSPTNTKFKMVSYIYNSVINDIDPGKIPNNKFTFKKKDTLDLWEDE
jgi:hypothetical protein